MPRSVLHLLLSLVLLVSQQMALAHGLSHWHAAHQPAPAMQPADQPDGPALLEFCAECAADAQLDLALPAPDHAFHPPHAAAALRAARCTEGVRPQAIRSCYPRGPPRAN